MDDTTQKLMNELQIPANARIPTHSELIRLADRVSAAGATVYRDSYSKEGRELLCFALGNGKRVIAVTAGAHSDEPTGLATAYYLTEALAFNPTFQQLLKEYTFVIFPILDPDGAALNQEWTLEHPIDFRSYLLHNYRNNHPANDCEHGIPIRREQECRPELAFFTETIDRYRGRIDHYVTLHTTHVLGGALFVTKRDFKNPRIMNALRELCESEGLRVMDYAPREERSIAYLGPGFLGAPYVSEFAEKFKNNPEVLAMLKMSTYEYVETRCGARTTMISELPFWVDARFEDTSEVQSTIADVLKAKIALNRDYLASLEGAIEELRAFGANSENPWFQAALFTTQMMPKALETQEAEIPEFEEIKGTRPDLVDLEKLPFENQIKLHRLYLKTLHRNVRTAEILDHHRDLLDRAMANLESVSRLRLLDLEKQVRIQAGLILQGLSPPSQERALNAPENLK